jgi:hypothetical protein
VRQPLITRIAGQLVFTATGDNGLGGFSCAKERIEKQMTAAKAWTFPDVRQTASTNVDDIV